LLLIGSKCKNVSVLGRLPPSTTTTSNETVKLYYKEKRILWLVGWLVGRLEARWCVCVCGGCCKVAYASAFTEETLIKPHIIAYEWLLSYLFLFIHICCWVMADYIIGSFFQVHLDIYIYIFNILYCRVKHTLKIRGLKWGNSRVWPCILRMSPTHGLYL